jgi:hypothetical protein
VKLLLLPMILATSACATGPWRDFYGDERSATVPADVRSFVIDAQWCAHFSGEEPYDAERAAFLKKRIDAMCPGLDQRHKQLMVKYAQNAKVRAIIEECRSTIHSGVGDVARAACS